MASLLPSFLGFIRPGFLLAVAAFLSLGLLPAQTPPPPVPSALPEPGSLTADELIARAQTAFRQGDFPTAEAFFLAFERDFGAEPQVAEIIERHKPLIALCLIANGKPAEARPYIEASLQQKDLQREIREELSFWLAIQLMQDGRYKDAQREFGTFFQQADFSLPKRQEALLLFGTCYVVEGYWRTAAEFFEAQIPNLRRTPGGAEYAGRAVVMRMLALIQSENRAAALELLRREFPNMGDITQLVSFQTLALQLGSQFMEEKSYHDAIACLQRIWSRERLLEHQSTRLADLQQRRAILAGDARRQSAVFQLDQMIQRVTRELQNFQEIEEFDAALRFRLAVAFQGLERYREAALIMEDMLQRMNPSPTVEAASLAVIQCWSQLERWPKAVEAAENYLLAFGDDLSNKNLPQVFFMQADAMMQMQRNAEANSIFTTIVSLFPGHPLEPKALFMQGFTSLLQDFNDAAIQSFDVVLRDHPESGLTQEAFYWKGMASSFMQDYPAAREQMEAYLETFREEGLRYEPEAVFRIAYCVFCEADYPKSIELFRQFLDTYGDAAPDADEARLLLGDALLGEALAEEGIAAYQSINPESTRFFEEGWFKTGTAFKLMEDVPRMRDHFTSFLEEYPDSQRMPEAVYWIGWTHVQDEDLTQAQDIYWSTLREHGNDPSLFAIEDLLTAMPKVYRRSGPDGLRELERALQDLHASAQSRKEDTLALRALWAEAQLHKASNPTLAHGILTRAGTLVDPEIHNPLIIADCADASRIEGRHAIAKKLYEELRRWHPNSYHKARAWLGLGYLAADQGRNADAIVALENFEQAAIASTEVPDALLLKASLQQKEGMTKSAESTLQTLLESPAATSRHKASTLLALGDLAAAETSHLKATAFFERVYVVYGKFLDLVAQAYLKRGQSLEALGEPTAAYEVYAELTARDELLEFPESRTARQNLTALAAFAPKPEEPAASSAPAPATP